MGILGFLFRKRQKSVIEDIDYKSFTIQKETSQKRYFNYNFGRFSSYTSTKYRVFYKGELITFPENLETNTGLPYLWKAYILKDAPVPAIIAGSQSLYLITEENNQLNMKTLAEQTSGFASLQWLDSKSGQPNENQKVHISEDTDSSNILAGGNFLLINESAVLEITTLILHPFNKYSSKLEGYHATKVVNLSPDQREIIFVGSKNIDGGGYDYAMLSFDYKNNTAYVVPFDQTETRMQDIHDITPEWFTTFFEWQCIENDKFRLVKRKLERPPYWQGRFSDNSTYFNLHPAKKEIMQVLSGFAEELLQLTESGFFEEEQRWNDNIHFKYKDFRYIIGYFTDQKSAHFSKYLYDKECPENQEIVRQVGTAFNEELNKGKFQEYFTTY